MLQKCVQFLCLIFFTAIVTMHFYETTFKLTIYFTTFVDKKPAARGKLQQSLSLKPRKLTAAATEGKASKQEQG